MLKAPINPEAVVLALDPSLAAIVTETAFRIRGTST